MADIVFEKFLLFLKFIIFKFHSRFLITAVIFRNQLAHSPLPRVVFAHSTACSSPTSANRFLPPLRRPQAACGIRSLPRSNYRTLSIRLSLNLSPSHSLSLSRSLQLSIYLFCRLALTVSSCALSRFHSLVRVCAPSFTLSLLHFLTSPPA